MPPSYQGLSAAIAQSRLKAEGFNELPRPDRRTPLRIILEVLREPMLALLLGGGVIYLALGDPQRCADPARLRHACPSLITVVQETRTERVLEALRDLTSPRALVIRDGERQAHCGTRGGARRYCGARRGRPRARRRGSAPMSRPANR